MFLLGAGRRAPVLRFRECYEWHWPFGHCPEYGRILVSADTDNAVHALVIAGIALSIPQAKKAQAVTLILKCLL